VDLRQNILSDGVQDHSDKKYPGFTEYVRFIFAGEVDQA
jgi:hypothetical protein